MHLSFVAPGPGDDGVYALAQILANVACLGPVLGEKAIKQNNICGYLLYLAALRAIGALG